MVRAQRGERGAFDELVGRYHRAVYSYARRVLGDDDLAQEATQETFVRAFKYRMSFDAASGTVRGWLFAVAANRIRDSRKARRERPSPIEEPEGLVATGEEGLEAFARGALREAVARAVSELAPELREVVALKYLSDLSYDEVAKALGLTVSAAKMRALRARDLLARRLAKLVQESGEATKSGEGESP
jgi:RNA polymerase sigma-70 factor (ECF subfamily)